MWDSWKESPSDAPLGDGSDISELETGLAEFGPLPADQRQSYGSTFVGYIRKIAGGFGKTTADNSCDSSCKQTEDVLPVSDSDASQVQEDKEKTKEEELKTDSVETVFPMERSMQATIRRIEHILRVGGEGIEQQRDHWASDLSTSTCHKCGERFSTFRRRHHCRLCGHLFCSACTNTRLPHDLVPRAAEAVRVCESCHGTTIQLHRTDYERSLTGSGGGGGASPPLVSPLASYMCGSGAYLSGGAWGMTGVPAGVNGTSSGSSRFPSGFAVATSAGGATWSADSKFRAQLGGVGGRAGALSHVHRRSHARLAMGFLEENYSQRSRHWSADDGGGFSTSMGDGALPQGETSDDLLPPYFSKEQLLEVHRRAVLGPRRLPGAAHRHRFKIHHNTFLTSDLTNWLLTGGYASTREEAIGICKSLLKNGLICCVVSSYPDADQFTDSGVPYRLVTSSATTSRDEENLAQDCSTTTGGSLTGTEITTLSGGWIPVGSMVEAGGRSDDGGGGLYPAVSYSKATDSVHASAAEVTLSASVHENVVSEYDPLEPLGPSQYSPRAPPSSRSSYEVVLTEGEDGDGARFLRKDNSAQESATPSTVAAELSETEDCLKELNAENLGTLSEVSGLSGSAGATQPSPASAIVALPGHYLRDPEEDAAQSDKLDEVWAGTSAAVLRQVCAWGGLEASWTPHLWPIIRHVARTVAPDVRNNTDAMDVRRYIRFKKLPGGSRSECRVLDGVVCSATVAHRRMSTRLSDPRLLLLADASDLFPGSGDLEPIVNRRAREAECSREVVMRVASYRPHIVLVEGSISHHCQENLQAHGLTVVLGVKRTVLQAVARVTQGEVVTDLTKRTTAPVLGMCHSFYTRTYDVPTTTETNMDKFKELSRYKHGLEGDSTSVGPNSLDCERDENKENIDTSNFMFGLSNGFAKPSRTNSLTSAASSTVKTCRKNLMFFTGCPAHLGCTVMLRGGDRTELSRVKNVVRFMVFVLYNWKFEKSFILQERASIASHWCVKDLIGMDGDDEDEESPSGGSARGINKENEGFKEVKTIADNSESDIKGSEEKLPLERCMEKSVVQRSFAQVVPASPSRVAEVVSDFSDPLRSDVLPGSSPRAPCQMVVHSIVGDPTDDDVFKKALNDVVLCTSPYIKKLTPYLETEAGSTSSLRKFFPKTLYYSKHLEGSSIGHGRSSKPKNQQLEDRVVSKNLYSGDAARPEINAAPQVKLMFRAAHPFISKQNLFSYNDPATVMALADFRARGNQLYFSDEVGQNNGSDDGDEDYALKPWKWDRKPKKRRDVVTPVMDEEDATPRDCGWGERGPDGEVDALHLLNHQHLAVLFTCKGMDTASTRYCVDPCELVMEFYGLNDSPLGAFLESYYFTDYKCAGGAKSGKPHKCTAEFHVRRFYHNTAAVQISAYRVDPAWFGSTRGRGLTAEDRHAIWMWNWCDTCKKSSPTVLMSPITWSLSLAKYLEIWLYAGGVGSHHQGGAARGAVTTPRAGVEGSTQKGAAGAGLLSLDCPHPLHRQHHRQLFYNNNRVAVVSYNAVPVRKMVLPPTPLPLQPPPPTKHEVVEQLRQLAVKGYSMFEGMLEKAPSSDRGLKVFVLKQRAQFKALIENIQLQLTSHKLEGCNIHPSIEHLSNLGLASVTARESSDTIVPTYDDSTATIASTTTTSSPTNTATCATTTAAVACSAGPEVFGDVSAPPNEERPGEDNERPRSGGVYDGSTSAPQSQVLSSAIGGSVVHGSGGAAADPVAVVAEQSSLTAASSETASVEIIFDLPDVGSQAMACNSQAMACNSQAMACNSQAMACNSQAMACNSQAKASGSQAISSGNQAMTSGSQAVASNRQAVTSGSQAMTRDGMAAAGGGAKVIPSLASIPAETMFLIQDKLVLLHRIIVRAVTHWNQKIFKKDETVDEAEDAIAAEIRDSTAKKVTHHDRQSGSNLTSSPYTNPRVTKLSAAAGDASSRGPSPDILPIGAATSSSSNTGSRPGTPVIEPRGIYQSGDMSSRAAASSVNSCSAAPTTSFVCPNKKFGCGSGRSDDSCLCFIENAIADLSEAIENGELRKREIHNIWNSVQESVNEFEVSEQKLSSMASKKNNIAGDVTDTSVDVCLSSGVSVSPVESNVFAEISPEDTNNSGGGGECAATEEVLAATAPGDGVADVLADGELREALGTSLDTVGSSHSIDGVDHASEASESLMSSPPHSPRLGGRGACSTSKGALQPLSLQQSCHAVGTAVTVRSFISSLWPTSSSLEIKYPFSPHLHFLGLEEALLPVAVHRDQPSTVIAHALASAPYAVQLRNKLVQCQQYQEQLLQQRSSGCGASPSSAGAAPPNTHLTLSWHDHGTFTCKVFFSAQFHLLRRLLLPPGGEAAFLRSLSASADWATKGGKSKSAFCKTTDDRFVLKELKSTEQEPIDQFCPLYLDYVTSALRQGRPSALARILGIYSVAYSKGNKTSKAATSIPSTAGGSGAALAPSTTPSSITTTTTTTTVTTRPLGQPGGKVFMVMENLFYGQNVSKIYDLKGNTSNRTTKEGPNALPGDVFLDCNLLLHRITEPLLVSPSTASLLPRTITPDSAFLQRCHIMDYSFLVGLATGAGGEPLLVVGIIDYIRKFTPDKFIENLVKENLLRTEDPTIVSPAQYHARFTRSIPRYLDKVPDSWAGLDTIDLQRRLQEREEEERRERVEREKKERREGEERRCGERELEWSGRPYHFTPSHSNVVMHQ